MIEVKLYANKSEDNVVYKNIKELLSTNCNLLDECSVIIVTSTKWVDIITLLIKFR